MSNIVVFFGHGLFMLEEKPAKVPVPTGCSLYLFARHREEINTERMDAIVYALAASLVYGRSDWVSNSDVDHKKEGNLRRIKTAGEMVHNYRLYPPEGLNDPLGQERIEDAVTNKLFKLVTTDDKQGVTLETLFKEHGAPGTQLLWVPCRAVEGLVGSRVDGFNYTREEQYFKSVSKPKEL